MQKVGTIKGSEEKRTDQWEALEQSANEAGWIPQQSYEAQISNFQICPLDQKAIEKEKEVWDRYLSVKDHQRLMYHELFRYEFYEGLFRKGFWGNIEDAIRKIALPETSRIVIFSAGTGRDLLKVGLAAGIWKSTAPALIRGTYKEINPKYFQLVNSCARIMVTEQEPHVYTALGELVDQLIQDKALDERMITIRRWDFRYKSPVVTESQDLLVLALVGNYAKITEQPFILREVSRCLKKGGHLVASTMLPDLNFSKARVGLKKLMIILSSPLWWPILNKALPWQVQWAKMAGEMNKIGYWENVPAERWMEFLKPAGMKPVKIYPAPSSLLPVEVLVARKE